VYPILFYLIVVTLLEEEYKLEAPCRAVSSGFLYSLTLRSKPSPDHPYPSPNVTQQISNPYTIAGKTVFLYVSIFTFLYSRWEDNGF
jgi:hypothetical protein